MKRIAILAVYDSEGIVHEYLEYYIESLCEAVSQLIIIVIGYLQEDGLKRLKKYSSEIYFKENKGYDAAAYKYVFENHLNIDRLNQYDELILTNDTCFGPFVPFRKIFDAMNIVCADFWGLKYIENNFLNHLQSNFLAFRKEIFQDIYQYFKEEIRDDDDKRSVVIKFEMRMFKVLVERGFRFKYYGISKDYGNYDAPDYCIKEERYPMLKKRCFEEGTCPYENCSHAIDYIQESTSYNVTMILDYVRYKYGFEKKAGKGGASYPAFVQKSICSQEDIQVFCKNHKDIYIYGTEYTASRIYGCYREYINNMRGFVVSDDQVVPKKHLGKKVFKLSEIENKTTAIIVGVSKVVTEEIRPSLLDYKNVLYLWGTDEAEMLKRG